MTSFPAARDPLPTISLVVNSCDRCRDLRTLLLSLHHQTYPDFEVVVVVGPTRDDTLEMLAEEFPSRIHLVRCPVFNLSVSRNLGLAHAAGEVVAFIDDDAVPSPTWLEQLVEKYRDPEIKGVGGRTYNARDDSGDLQFRRGMVSALGEQLDVASDAGRPPRSAARRQSWFPRFHGTNMSYRRQGLLQIGGFDERFEYLFDDSDIGVRLGRAGLKLVQLEEGVVYHLPAKGRNRGERYDLNWYCWMRSTLYFALKNGPPSVGRRRSLARAVRHGLHFHDMIGAVRDGGEFTEEQYRRARRMLCRAWIHGLWQGLFGRRRIPGRIELRERPFRRFQDSGSRYQPHVPITGPTSEAKLTTLEKEPLRVCLLSVGYPPRSTEGIARHTHMLALGLRELGHEVHVITLGERHRVFSREGVFVRQVSLGERRRHRWMLEAGYPNLYHWLDYGHAVWEEIRSLRINHDVQVIDSPLWNLEGLVAAVAAEAPVCIRIATAMKQISDIHGRPTPENRRIAELEAEFLRRADGYVTNSEASIRSLREVYGIDPDEKVHALVPHGVVPAPEEAVTPLAVKPPGEAEVLFVGRLEGRKGILDLFEAIPRVLERHPKVRFRIAGSDNSQEDGFRQARGMDYPTYFRRRYGESAAAVEFLGYVPDAELDELYQSCDLFVAPSIYESFGLIYLEAMNFARPVIGCAAGGPKEIIVDGETGLQVPPRDPARLADAISALVESPGRRREMGLRGRRRLLERYTHVAMADGFVEVYRRLVEIRRQRG